MNALVLLAQAANPDTGAAAAGGIFAGLAGLMVVFWVIAIAGTIFTVWMLVDVLTSNRETNEKILWALVILLTNLLGAVIYFIVGRKGRTRAAGVT